MRGNSKSSCGDAQRLRNYLPFCQHHHCRRNSTLLQVAARTFFQLSAATTPFLYCSNLRSRLRSIPPQRNSQSTISEVSLKGTISEVFYRAQFPKFFIGNFNGQQLCREKCYEHFKMLLESNNWLNCRICSLKN